jgi:hypothetical protein
MKRISYGISSILFENRRSWERSSVEFFCWLVFNPIINHRHSYQYRRSKSEIWWKSFTHISLEDRARQSLSRCSSLRVRVKWNTCLMNASCSFTRFDILKPILWQMSSHEMYLKNYVRSVFHRLNHTRTSRYFTGLIININQQVPAGPVRPEKSLPVPSMRPTFGSQLLESDRIQVSEFDGTYRRFRPVSKIDSRH